MSTLVWVCLGVVAAVVVTGVVKKIRMDALKELVLKSTWGQRYNAALSFVVLILLCTVAVLWSDRNFTYTHVHGLGQQQQQQQQDEWGGYFNNIQTNSKCGSCNETSRSGSDCFRCRGSGREAGRPCSDCAGAGKLKCYSCSR